MWLPNSEKEETRDLEGGEGRGGVEDLYPREKCREIIKPINYEEGGGKKRRENRKDYSFPDDHQKYTGEKLDKQLFGNINSILYHWYSIFKLDHLKPKFFLPGNKRILIFSKH